MSIDPILAGTDGEPRAELAVDKAGELALALDAPVHVVCVASAIYGKDWPAAITAEQIVDKAADRLQSRGITVDTHVPKGHQGEGALDLVAVADREHAQIIVVGNKGMTGVRRLLGSLPNRVSHQARCDVLIVPTQSRSLPQFAGRCIVVGSDGSSGATRAVAEAIRLAKALEGELHVVSAAQQSGSPDSALATAAAQAADEGVDATTHALPGDPVDALMDVAEKSEAAIIVVGSKGMQAGEREWFGSVPDKLSHKGTFSVLIVFTGDASGSGDGDAANTVLAGDTASSVDEATT